MRESFEDEKGEKDDNELRRRAMSTLFQPCTCEAQARQQCWIEVWNEYCPPLLPRSLAHDMDLARDPRQLRPHQKYTVLSKSHQLRVNSFSRTFLDSLSH